MLLPDSVTGVRKNRKALLSTLSSTAFARSDSEAANNKIILKKKKEQKDAIIEEQQGKQWE